MKSRAVNFYGWKPGGSVAHHESGRGNEGIRTKRQHVEEKPSTFRDVHHIAAQILANIFVNIFYIAFEENRGFHPGSPVSAVASISVPG